MAVGRVLVYAAASKLLVNITVQCHMCPRRAAPILDKPAGVTHLGQETIKAGFNRICGSAALVKCGELCVHPRRSECVGSQCSRRVGREHPVDDADRHLESINDVRLVVVHCWCVDATLTLKVFHTLAFYQIWFERTPALRADDEMS